MVLAGLWAGGINAIVGSGSLVTFPTLLLLGVPPVPANISNNISMLGGGVTSIVGYRRELQGGSAVLRRLAPMTVIGAAIGALLLLKLPASAFRAIVPVLIILGLAMVVWGPRLQSAAARRHEERGRRPAWQQPALLVGVLLAGAYGGYFGAAQGVIVMGLLSMFSTLDDLQIANAYKNVLAFVANGVAAVVFVVTAHDQIRWLVVLFVGGGALVGGWLGASFGRRLPSSVLRAIIVVIGLIGVAKVIWFP